MHRACLAVCDNKRSFSVCCAGSVYANHVTHCPARRTGERLRHISFRRACVPVAAKSVRCGKYQPAAFLFRNAWDYPVCGSDRRDIDEALWRGEACAGDELRSISDMYRQFHLLRICFACGRSRSALSAAMSAACFPLSRRSDRRRRLQSPLLPVIASAYAAS